MASPEFSIFDVSWPVDGGSVTVCDDPDGDGISVIIEREAPQISRVTLSPSDVHRLNVAIRFLEETRGE